MVVWHLFRNIGHRRGTATSSSSWSVLSCRKLPISIRASSNNLWPCFVCHHVHPLPQLNGLQWDMIVVWIIKKWFRVVSAPVLSSSCCCSCNCPHDCERAAWLAPSSRWVCLDKAGTGLGAVVLAQSAKPRIRDKRTALQLDILIGDGCQLIASFKEIKRHEQVVVCGQVNPGTDCDYL